MDVSLRELGVGDLGVGRRVKAMAQGFYGRIGAYEVHHIWGRGAIDAARAACAENTLIVLAAKVADLSGPCQVVDGSVLTETGALALYLEKEALVHVPTNRPGAQRPWAP